MKSSPGVTPSTFQALAQRLLQWPQLQLFIAAAGVLCLMEIVLIFGSYAVFGSL